MLIAAESSPPFCNVGASPPRRRPPPCGALPDPASGVLIPTGLGCIGWKPSPEVAAPAAAGTPVCERPTPPAIRIVARTPPASIVPRYASPDRFLLLVSCLQLRSHIILVLFLRVASASRAARGSQSIPALLALSFPPMRPPLPAGSGEFAMENVIHASFSEMDARVRPRRSGTRKTLGRGRAIIPSYNET
jgi:hypothetical protein